MIENISVTITEHEELPLIIIKGEIDIYTCGKLRDALAQTLETTSSNFVLDLNELQYIDSTGLGTIAHSARALEEKNGFIHVICKKPQIKKIFEVSGLTKKNIKLYENITELKILKEKNV